MSKRLFTLFFVGATAGFGLATVGCPGKPKPGPTDGGGSVDGGTGPVCAIAGATFCATANDCLNTTNYKCDVTPGTPDVNCCVFFCNPANGPADCVAGNQPCKGTPLGCVCDEGVCKSKVCSTDADCNSASVVCKGGSCVAPDPASAVASCVVEPNPALLHAGQSQQLSVTALDANGKALVTAAGSATWSVTPAAAGTIAGSVLTVGTTGSTAFGDTTITASFAGGKSCSGIATVYAPPASGARLVLIDAAAGIPVSGATVQYSDATGKLLGTAIAGDAMGQYPLPATAPSGALLLNAFDANYQYASIALSTLSSTDLVLLLAQNPVIDTATSSPVVGGYTGDFRKEPGVLDPGSGEPQGVAGDIHFGLAGTSIPENLLDISLDALLGPTHVVTINIGGSHPVKLPQGVEIGLGDNTYFKCSYDGLGPAGGCGLPPCSATVTSNCLNSGTSPSAADWKDSAFACGSRSGWGIGGSIPLSEVLSLIGGGGTSTLSVSSLLSVLLPAFSTFSSGVAYQVPYTMQPPLPANQVTDSCSGKVFTDATPIPDPTKLSPATLSLDTQLALVANVTLPALPKQAGACQQTALVLAGAVEPGLGLLPLGLSAGSILDSTQTADTSCVTYDTDTPTNADGHVTLHLAPEHGGVERSPYGVIALALNIGSLAGSTGGSTPFALSGLVQTNPAATGLPYNSTVTFSGATQGFLSYAEAATYTASSRAFVNAAVTGSTWMRLRFQDDQQREWATYFDPTSTGIVLPTPPTGMADRSVTSTGVASATEVQAVEGNTGASYNGFLDFSKGALAADLANNMVAFSTVAITPK